MKTELKQDITTTIGQFYDTLSLFTQNEVNQVPFEGSWTGGQVARHIIKSTSGLRQVCEANTQKLPANYDEKIPLIKEIFLNFSTKYNSPDFIYPEDREYDKTELLSSLQRIEKEMQDIAENYDLTLTCMDFEIPGIGNLTIYELLNFCVMHSKRHLNQLQNVYNVVKN
ncbi:DinB family protein [Flavobacterium sp. N502536]|uniref:DinB family protein n=1 Tax=Flavobacterium sp. N502536 TaxID=2986837 RepID=UPI0022218844|nr:DinB family protein [Flavobacterium sp. N502536]